MCLFFFLFIGENLLFFFGVCFLGGIIIGIILFLKRILYEILVRMKILFLLK